LGSSKQVAKRVCENTMLEEERFRAQLSTFLASNSLQPQNIAIRCGYVVLLKQIPVLFHHLPDRLVCIVIYPLVKLDRICSHFRLVSNCKQLNQDHSYRVEKHQPVSPTSSLKLHFLTFLNFKLSSFPLFSIFFMLTNRLFDQRLEAIRHWLLSTHLVVIFNI
jgi:hypothetical protein